MMNSQRADFMDDNTPANWVLLKVVNKKIVFSSGCKGREEFIPFLTDFEMCFVFYRIMLKENDYGFVPKFAFISWVGKSVKAVQKARNAPVSIAISNYIGVRRFFLPFK